MTDLNLEQLESRARQAYERGRWRLGLASAWPALVLCGLCIALGGRPHATVGVALVLAATIAIAVQRGRHYGRAVVPGLLAGALPLLAGLLACRLPHVCGGAACMEFCAPLCLGAGAVAGLTLVVRQRRAGRSSAPSLWVATVIALLTGALGCFFVGIGGLAGMALGLSLGAAVGWLPRTGEG
jgi:hypothetical protein